ncbi:hypothetical protein D3C85_504340 [compost metagenome]
MSDLIERIKSDDTSYGDQVVNALGLTGVSAFHAAAGAAFGLVDDAIRLVQMAGLDAAELVAEAVAELRRAESSDRDFAKHLAAQILIAALKTRGK